jgi:hypothetical protein
MDNQIQLFSDLNFGKDRLMTMDALLTSQLFYVYHYFERTREFESCFSFVDFCYSIINANANKITKEKFERWDRALIGLQLFSYDHLNEWEKYIEHFDWAFNERPYAIKYYRTNNTDHSEHYGRYLLKIEPDTGNHLVHFLFNHDYRYQLICRKQKKLEQGEKIGNLLRHQKDELPEEEKNERFRDMVRLFSSITKAPL